MNYSKYPAFVQHVIQVFVYHGQYGVQLFFAVSGYIMISRYQIVSSVSRYMFLRYTRLIPMLCLIVVFNLLMFNFYSISNKGIADSLPSILIIDPQVFNIIFHTETFHWIDDSLWTLFVEIRFYFIFGLTMKILGSRKLITKKLILFTLCLFSQVLYLTSKVFDFEFLNKICFWILIPDYFIYFLIGIILYSSKSFKEKSLSLALVPLGFIYLVMLPNNSSISWETVFSKQSRTIAMYLVFIFFIFSISKYLIFKIPVLKLIARGIGFPSYISYLLHQNLFLMLYPTLSKLLDPMFLCIFLFLSITFVSFFLSKNIEPILINSVRSKFNFR